MDEEQVRAICKQVINDEEGLRWVDRDARVAIADKLALTLTAGINAMAAAHAGNWEDMRIHMAQVATALQDAERTARHWQKWPE